MIIGGIFFVVFGACCIVFRRRVGLTGSEGRAILRHWFAMPDDEAYIFMAGFIGWLCLAVGSLTIALSLAL